MGITAKFRCGKKMLSVLAQFDSKRHRLSNLCFLQANHDPQVLVVIIGVRESGFAVGGCGMRKNDR